MRGRRQLALELPEFISYCKSSSWLCLPAFEKLMFSPTGALYVWVNSRSNMPMFCLKKLISQPREVQNPPNLTQGTLTQYILRLVIFRPHPTPPIYLKMPKCAKFCTFGESRFKHTSKVGVHRENLLMGNVAQTFLGAFYICWDYVISFSQHFPMRKFSPSPSTSPSPESHLLLQNWLKFRK